MLWGASLLALSRARLIYLTIGGMIFFLFPRFARWKITWMRYSTFVIGPNLSTHIELDIGVDVYNPNYVGAYLHNATLHLYRVGDEAVPAQHTLKTIGKPFGMAMAEKGLTFDKDIFAACLCRLHLAGSSAVPKRGHFDLVSHVSILDLPIHSALSFLYEIIAHRGVVNVRGIGTANIKAAKQELIIWLDCLQHVNLLYFPVRIEHSDCTYRISNRLLNDIYQSTEVYHPFLLEAFASFDQVGVV